MPKQKVTGMPLLMTIRPQDMHMIIEKDPYIDADGSTKYATSSRQTSSRTVARYAVPPISLHGDSTPITATSGGLIIEATQEGAVVQLPPLADLLRQSAPVFNASPFDLLVASIGEAEPFRLPGKEPETSFVIPPWGSVEFRPIMTSDPARQGWYPRASLPDEVTSVAGRLGDVTIFPADIIGLGSSAVHPATDFATAAQGGRADTAVQPAGLAPYATTTATTAAINSAVSAHAGNTSNPHAVTKAQVGLGNADNTSDAAKPISTAMAVALAGKAPLAHTHAVGDVTGLQSALDGKAASAHTHNIANVTGLQTALDAKLATNGNGSALTGLTAVQVGLGSVDNTTDAAKPISTATAAALAGKAPLPHTHAVGDVAGLQAALDGKASLASIKTTVAVGTLTRAAADATGTQSVALSFLPAYVMFSALDDGDATVSSDGWDDGAIATCTTVSSTNVLLTLIGALGLASTIKKSHVLSIWIQNAAGAGHSAKVSAKSATGFTLAWTRIGAGRPVTVKYLAVQ